MNGHYILPGELASLIAFLFVPPLLIALVGQLLFLRGRPGLAALAFITTAVGSVLIGAGWILFAPSILPRWLGVQDLNVAGSYWPVMPLAFAVVTLIAPFAAVIVGRRARPA